MPVTLNELERLLDYVNYGLYGRKDFWSNNNGKFTPHFERCQDELQMLILWHTAPYLKKEHHPFDIPGVLKECVDVIENADKSLNAIEKLKDLKESVRRKFQTYEGDLDRRLSNIQDAIYDCESESDSDDDDDVRAYREIRKEDCEQKYEDEADEECSKYLEKCYKLTLEFFSDLHKLYLKAKETAEKPKAKETAEKPKATTTDAFTAAVISEYQKSMKTTEKKKAQPKSEKKKAQPKSEKKKAQPKSEKEKAKEKAKAEKAKEKAAAEKAKEKAKAEKEKAKAKAAAEKAKTKAVAEKEKAKAKAAAEKAKAKAVAEKEQEKAKKKAAADKAKAKEKKAKDKCADARGKALEALATATAMKASKISKKFLTCEAKIKK